jgi:hypothetical protein
MRIILKVFINITCAVEKIENKRIFKVMRSMKRKTELKIQGS